MQKDFVKIGNHLIRLSHISAIDIVEYFDYDTIRTGVDVKMATDFSEYGYTYRFMKPLDPQKEYPPDEYRSENHYYSQNKDEIHLRNQKNLETYKQALALYNYIQDNLVMDLSKPKTKVPKPIFDDELGQS